MDLEPVDRIIEEYEGEKASLVMILQDIQDVYNYLPQPALLHASQRLGVSAAQLYNVATFYSTFSLTERGRHVIRVCDGTACHLRGSTNIREEISRRLGIGVGETTADEEFTLETVACLGACALAPVMTIGSKYYGKLTADKIEAILDRHMTAQGGAED